MPESLLTPEARAAVGRHRPVRQGLVTARGIRQYCAAVDDRHPLYIDPDAARAAGYADVIAPPLYPPAVTRPVPFHDGLLEDGQYADHAPPGLSHLQSLLAGQEWEFCRPAVAGEWVTEEVSIAAIEEREGRNGPLLFVTEETLLRSEHGDDILRGRNTLLFREPPPPSPAFSGEVPLDHSGPFTSRLDSTLIKRPAMVSLFMFDATIWATHRLHWDAGQARREGLPGPVLPGWMVASYIAEHARNLAPPGQAPAQLSVRYTGFAHPGDTLSCTGVADPGAGGAKLAIINQDGREVLAGTTRFA